MTKRIAFSAIAMALTVVCLFGASTIPTAKISLLAIATVFGAVTVYEYGPKYGFIHYIGVSILSLLLAPKKSTVLIYIVFLGYYPLVKLYIEQIDKVVKEWVIKIIFFNVFLVIAYTIFKMFLIPIFNTTIVVFILKYLALIIIGLELVFVIYDVVLSYLIAYYKKFISKKHTSAEK